MGLYAEGNGEKTGFYRAGEGKSQSLKWRLDGDVLEFELIGDGTFWTGEKVARFSYSVSWSGRELTLVPTAAGQRSVTLKSTKRPFPT
ncbi:MAG: hypothetical protein FJ271_10405 [Planctomycetes bacterium]|nr:hypothetical protein [Planctomycetota bacterium]